MRDNEPASTLEALSIRIRGIVQGVGFRPFIHRLAHAHRLEGWVLNGPDGVDIHVEGPARQIQTFIDAVKPQAPPAAKISAVKTRSIPVQGYKKFEIRDSENGSRPTTRISPDLPVCKACLEELFTASDLRCRYPYINCTNCGPRYSILQTLPYDRPHTTMSSWPMCSTCQQEYDNALNRRFHAQPVACPNCGPQYYLSDGNSQLAEPSNAITESARLLRSGHIVAVKGLGGYHLACNARDAAAVQQLRLRKYRKEKPFALLARRLETIQALAKLTPSEEKLLTDTPRPIVLLPARFQLPEIAPQNHDVGVMLAYTPLHHLLFDAGAPELLVMTSANRSSEPIAYQDEDAFKRLQGIADAFLVGERPIARRIDDSVARNTPFGPTVLRRARGYAPAAVTDIPTSRPVLAVGADLKNSVTLVVDGQAFVSQHIGDLAQYSVLQAHKETVSDLLEMYSVAPEDLLVCHDQHPQFQTTLEALDMPGETAAIQHHKAHIASALAEQEAWDRQVIGFAFDGTGYGSEKTIWGGEVFTGSIRKGLRRQCHLHPARLPGGDAAMRAPVQAAAGFLEALEDLPDFTAPPFYFPKRYLHACELLRTNTRVYQTTSVGRLFDTAAALAGFTRETTYEGQAAIWLEHRARSTDAAPAYPFPGLDFRPLLQAVIRDRQANVPLPRIARAFHKGIARGVVDTALRLYDSSEIETLVLSGGVFQNQVLLQEIKNCLSNDSLRFTVWINQKVPPNDGGISLGQAALGALQHVPGDAAGV